MSRQQIENAIRQLRFARGEMTQQQLALRAGVTRQTIIAIEKGHYSPSLEVAFRIAQALETPLEQVFFFRPADATPSNPEKETR